MTPVFNTAMDFGAIDTAKDRCEQIGMSSNFMDHTPTSQLKKMTAQQHTDVASTLTSAGLEKYIRKFDFIISISSQKNAFYYQHKNINAFFSFNEVLFGNNWLP